MIFTFVPTEGVRIDYKPRIQKAQFGDGYAQRVRTGINTNPKVWELNFTGLDDALANQIEDFLKSVSENCEPFDWTDLRGVTSKYICEGFQRTWAAEDANDITAKFEQFFG